MRGLSANSGARDRDRVRHDRTRNFALYWSAPLALMLAASCAEQEEPSDNNNNTGTSGSSSTAGSSSGGGGASAGSGGSGGSSAGTGGNKAGSMNGGSGGNAAGSGGGGGDGGMATGGGGAGGMGGAGGKAGSGGGGAGGMSGAGGASGAGGSAGAGGKGGSGGTGGAPGNTCQNSKKDANETDVDCGGACTTKCATGKMCGDLDDCATNNVCSEDTCRVSGCNATDCAYVLTRYIIAGGTARGQAFVSWDSDSLDLTVNMLDATPFDDSPENWQDDSIEIYLDLNNAKTATYQTDDFQISVARHAGNNVVGIGTNLNTANVTVTRTTDAQGYTLIVGVPWSALNNATFPSGKTIGFDIAVNDDTDGGVRNGQIMLYGSGENWRNTSQFGTLMITP